MTVHFVLNYEGNTRPFDSKLHETTSILGKQLFQYYKEVTKVEACVNELFVTFDVKRATLPYILGYELGKFSQKFLGGHRIAVEQMGEEISIAAYIKTSSQLKYDEMLDAAKEGDLFGPYSIIPYEQIPLILREGQLIGQR